MTLRRGWQRLAALGVGMILTLADAPHQAAAAPPSPRAPKIPTLFSKNRSFRIPFNIDPADRKKLREVQLWVSDDLGDHWEPKSRTTVDRPYFPFRAAHDGEYWFAVQTIDSAGRVLPEKGEVEPNMKVIVDTTAPSLVLEQDGRRGSVASIHWEARDEHLDLKSLVIEYQEEGARRWRQVPIQRLSQVGSESWDAGTAEPLKVRASVDDKAGNRGETVINLDEGTPSNPALLAKDAPQFAAPPPISQISSGPNFSPVEETPREEAAQDPFPPPRSSKKRGGPSAAGPEPANSFPSEEGPSAAPARGRERGGTGGTGPRTFLIADPKFSLQYAVDDAGPNGPASVELWMTQDGGRTWNQHAQDTDRLSPIEIDLGGEGTFGLCLVARSASGLGDQPPTSGDPPQVWVEVDSTPPSVQLAPPQIGTGSYVGKVAISWRAADPHLTPRPITLYWRADQPNANWQPIAGPLENTGQYVWTVPTSIPPKIHIRVEAIDTAGNRGSDDTSAAGPVIVDRTRPRSRIISLDQGNRTGASSGFRPIR